MRVVAQDKLDAEPEPDFADGVITVVNADGTTAQFATFGEALAYSDDGDILQVGMGTYSEAFELDESVTIVGETGAVLDGSSIVGNATGFTSTIEVYDGFSGGSISGIEVVAVQGGSAFETITGEAVNDISLQDNTFDAGANSAGSLVYFNPGTTNAEVVGNTFEGALLAASPFLGIEADNVLVSGNDFGEHPDSYVEVEVFPGLNLSTADVELVGNSGLEEGDVFITP